MRARKLTRVPSTVTEHAPQSLVDSRVFPRLCALAEAMWSPKNVRDWEAFKKRMATHYKRLDTLGVTYYAGEK